MDTVPSFQKVVVSFLVVILVQFGSGIDIMTNPDISIGGWMENDYEALEWHTNSSPPLGQSPYPDSILVPSSVRGLSLVCNATYPVEWRFHRERWGRWGRLQYALRTTRVSDGLDVILFSSELSFFTFESNSVSGNYTCQKVGNPALSQSIYVFWEGGSPPFLTLARAFRIPPTIPFRNDSVSFTLPCTVSIPTIEPHLTKEEGTMQVGIRRNSSVAFDPRVGFTMTNLPNPYGRYTCQGGDDDDENEGDGDVISFNVVNADDGPKPEFNETIKHGSYYLINSTSKMLMCCAAGQKPPKLKLVECDHPTICALAKHSLHVMESGKKRELGCSMVQLHSLRAGVFRCVGAGIDVVREYFYPMPEKGGRWGGKGRGGGKGGRGGKDKIGDKNKHDSDQHENNQQDKGDSSTTTPAPALVIAEDPYFDWNEAEGSKMMLVTKLTGPVYIGENRTFSCRVSHFYYAQGLVWGITFANQSISYLNGREKTDDHGGHGHWSKNIHHFKILQGNNQQMLDITITADLQNITCYAPVWNSTEWHKKSLNIIVKSPTAPQLVGNPHKEYTWYLTDTKKSLQCKFSGEPLPTVTWQKGNVTLSKDITTENGTSTLSFPLISVDTDGLYECLLSNPADTISKTFRVTVEHSASSAISGILIFCAIGFVVVSAIAAVMFKYMKSQNSVIHHLANLAFKDVTNNGDPSVSTGSTATARSNVSLNTNGVVLPPLSQTGALSPSSPPISINNSTSPTISTNNLFTKTNGGGGGHTNSGFVFDYSSNRHSTPAEADGSQREPGSLPPSPQPPLSSFSSYHKF